MRYRDAGVDIDEADRAVSSIKKMARATFTRGVLADRLIVATAIHHGARLVTADAALRALKAVQTVW